MSRSTESKGGIKDGIKKRKEGMDDRGEHMGTVVDEMQILAKTSQELHLSTTSEGAAQVQKELKDAQAAIQREFKGQEGDIETKFTKCKDAEKDLQKRTQAGRSDSQKARAAAGRIKETGKAKDRMVAADKAAAADADFTDSQKQRQGKERSDATQRRDQQRAQLNSMRLAF